MDEHNSNGQILPTSWLLMLVPFSTVFVACIFVVLGCIAQGNPMPQLQKAFIDPRAFSIFVYGIGNGISIIFLHRLLKKRGLALDTVGFRSCAPGRTVAWSAAAIVTVTLLYPIIENCLKRMGIPMYWNPNQSLPVANSSSLNLLFVVLGSVILVPLGEDAIFRGYMLALFRGKIGTSGAIIVSSLIFAVMHLPFFGPGFTIYVFLWAIVSCLLAIRLNSIYPCFVFHATNNLIAYILLPLLAAQP